MNLDSVNEEIWECRQQIDDNDNEISSLRSKIEEMENIYDKLSSSRDSFGEFLGDQQNGFERMSETYQNCNFAKKCAEESIEFLRGNEADRAVSSFDDAKEQVQDKINESYNEIDDLENENNYLYNRIDNLEALAYRLRQEEEDE